MKRVVVEGQRTTVLVDWVMGSGLKKVEDDNSSCGLGYGVRVSWVYKHIEPGPGKDKDIILTQHRGTDKQVI